MTLGLLNRPRRDGSALVIVLVLLSVMSALVVGNMATLRRLKFELQRLDARQVQRLERSAPKPKSPTQPPVPPANKLPE